MNKKWIAIVKEAKRLFSLLTCGDKLIFTIFLLFALSSFAFKSLWQQQGSEAVIEINGRLYAKISLLQSTQLPLPGVNGEVVIKVEDGAVWVSESSCAHKVCMRRGKIRQTGDMIVCAPNRVVVRVVGTCKRPFDMITG